MVLIRSGVQGKFAKGSIPVVPNSSRAYLSGRPVSVYYEIYNLSQDEVGGEVEGLGCRGRFHLSCARKKGGAKEARPSNAGGADVPQTVSVGARCGCGLRVKVMFLGRAMSGSARQDEGHCQSFPGSAVLLLKAFISERMYWSRSLKLILCSTAFVDFMGMLCGVSCISCGAEKGLWGFA